MINAIIFSKDRPLQLRLLIESIIQNSDNIFNINVLYKFSDEFYESGYNKLKSEFKNHQINYVQESDFKKQVLDLLKSDFEYSCFFTDDDIIYNSFEESIVIETFIKNPDIFCFSLRLGKNTDICYTMNAKNVLIPLTESDNTLIWDWTKHYLDFGYPLSVDGHIFKTKDILKLSSSIGYKNPNTYEAALQIYDTFPKNKMAAFKKSKLVNTPVNIVQNVFENRKAEIFNYTTENLNKLYLNDKIISLNDIDFSNINGCHQELELKFKNNQNA